MTEDAWGYDPLVVRAVDPALGLAARWWRLQVEGAERVPPTGPVLVAANRGGPPPWTALMVARALGRPARVLAPDGTFALPFVSIAARRLGAVPPRPANAERLLEEGHAVIAVVETGAAHRVGRFESAGVALRARAPVVPCAVIGAREAWRAALPLRWRIDFGEPIDLASYGPGAEDRAALLEAADAVRDRIQTMVYDNLVRREGAFR